MKKNINYNKLILTTLGIAGILATGAIITPEFINPASATEQLKNTPMNIAVSSMISIKI